ncbi:MAG: hypothetical protein J7507_13620 [Pseudoxanthomonas sp.]|nr:hypothetical protein [Pseudoxanthomonas sp.]
MPPDTGSSRDATGARLRALLQAGDIDAALQAGLMDYAASHEADDAPIRAMQDQLRTAWDARNRYRAREARLARRAAERAARRTSAVNPPAAPAHGTKQAAVAAPALPAAAVAALARARARASGRTGG